MIDNNATLASPDMERNPYGEGTSDGIYGIVHQPEIVKNDKILSLVDKKSVGLGLVDEQFTGSYRYFRVGYFNLLVLFL